MFPLRFRQEPVDVLRARPPVTNGLQLLNVQPAWQCLLKGAVLVLAVLADVSFKKK